MLKLFHNPDSRSSRFIWLLEELGIDYELNYTDIPRWSGKGAPDPANPHPDKRVPALLHDGQLVTESAAIALYLTDTFPAVGLGAEIGSRDRAAYLTWLAFYAGEVEFAFGIYRRGWIDNDPHGAMRKDYERMIQRVLSALSSGEYLMGKQFSSVDILMSSPFQWIRDFGPPSREIDGWLERLAARPAAQRAEALDRQPSEG
jgi:glutathione S-transferase